VQGNYATVGGGASNVASGEYATVPEDRATRPAETILGRRLPGQGQPQRLVRVADYTAADLSSTTANQFRVRPNGGSEFMAGNTSYGSASKTAAAATAFEAMPAPRH